MNKLISGVLSLACAVVPQFVRAVTPGQTDTFAGGSLDNWFAGGLGFGSVPPVPPSVQATGGPGGAGDSYMLVTGLGGQGAGSRIAVINTAQWSGNYLTSGVSSIGIDLKNFGSTDLTVRLLFEDPMGGPPVDQAVTTLGVVLPAGGGWTHAVFGLSPSSFTVLSGTLTPLLSNTTLIRIIDSPTPTDAVPIVGKLGIDNVQAIPEPETYALILAGLSVLGFVAKRRKESSHRPG